MSKKNWIGELRIYLLHRNTYRSFCWISMWKDASLFFALTSKTMRFTEYGSSIVRSGYFVDHLQTLTRGNLDIKETHKPHISFHPPSIGQKSGIAHMVDVKGKVDEWELDWFPVRRPQSLLFAYTGDIAKLDKVTTLKGRSEVVNVPDKIHCLRMELILRPIPKSPKRIDQPNALTNIIGFAPHYIVCCHFDPINIVDAAVYIATDEYVQ